MTGSDGRVRDAGTIVDVLLARDRDGGGGGYSFLQDGESISEHLSWRTLSEQVRSVSAALRRHSAPGERALLLFRPGLGFLVAFLGCLHAGIVAVPCVPPTPPLKRAFRRIAEVLRVSAPSTLLASDRSLFYSDGLSLLAPELARCPVIVPSELPDRPSSLRSLARPDGVAFLQFTSGSTSSPRGVMVTHQNLIHNLNYIHECFEHSRASVSVTWLPAFHDMGLIDGLLGPVFGGFHSYAMPPFAFAQRPERWLRAIDRFAGTHGGGPNFAYDLCAQKVSVDTAAAISLKSWRIAYNGAEPIRGATMDAFVQRFSGSGFRPEAFYPCYGLAEATLKVSGGAHTTLRHRTFDADALERGVLREVPAHGPRARSICSSGRPDPDFELAIADPDSHAKLADACIGEVWLAGPSVAAGYFQDRTATAETFGATLADCDRGPFLRTGDLGFVLDGELYVVGRRKDLIILAGRNLYPQDVEYSAVSAHPSLANATAVAFAIDDGTQEHLAVLVEAGTPHAPDLIGAVRRAIARDHQVDASVVALVGRSTLLRTSSGKIQRRACRQAYGEGRIAVLERYEVAEERSP